MIKSANSASLIITQTKTFYLVILAIYVLAIISQNNFTLNWDVTWLLQVSQNLLAGGSYNKDFLEINPPLILYFYAPPVIFAKVFSINIVPVLRTYMFLVATLSLTLCYSLLIKIFKQQDEKIFQLFFFALTVGFLILPFQQFAQREHISIILAMPYLLLITGRLQGNKPSTKSAVFIGFLAAFGFGLKQYFLAPLALSEIYFLLCSRKISAPFRPESITLATVLVLYVLAIVVFQPDYFYCVTLAIRNFYHPYQTSLLIMVINQLDFCCYFALILFFIQYQNNPYKILSSVMACATAGYFISFLLPRILWDYHATPFFIMATVLTVLQLGILAQYPAKSKWEAFYLTLFTLTVAAFIGNFVHVAGLLLVFYPSKFFLYYAILFACLFMITRPEKSWLKIMLMIGVIIGVGFIFLYPNQRSSWNQHLFYLLLSMFALLYSLFVPGNFTQKYKAVLTAVLTMLLFIFPFYYATGLYQSSLDTKQYTETLTAFLQTHASHKPVYYFTNWSNYLQPAINVAGAKFYSRTEDTGWIPAVLSRKDPMLAQDRDFYINLIADDLNQHKPEYVFVDLNGSKYIPKNLHFAYLSFFSQNAGFREAWKPYRYLTTLKEQDAYNLEVYQRMS